MSSFQGFLPEALTFFAGLEVNNSKTYWDANKAVWESKVREPMLEFLDALHREYQPFHLFRQNRDLRFSRDKSPYKTTISAVSESKGAAVYGVRLAASGLFVICGAYMLAKDQLERFRVAIDHDLYGTQLEEIICTLTEAKLQVRPGSEEPLKTNPQGYPKDHPRVNLLRWKGLAVTEDFGAPEWLYTSQAVEKVEAFWHAAKPLKVWLDTYVGPSQESSERSDRRSR